MIVIFGAGGFIGTYLTDELLKEGYEVVASDFGEISEAYYRKQGIPYYPIDITQKSDFARLPSSEIEAVMHLACVQPANVSAKNYNPVDYIKVNVIGTLNILEFCRDRNVPKIIYACSHRNTQGMWAEKSHSSISECDGRSIKFTGEYAIFSIAESAATDCVEHYSQTYGVEGIAFRLPPVYGYGPHTEIFKDGQPLKTGFQIFIENAKQSLPIVLWGDASNGRDIIYVKDVVAAFVLALKTAGATGLFNISSGRRLSLKEQADAIIRVFSPPDKPSEIRYQPEKQNFIESYVYNIDKAKRTFGWYPKYSFEDMLIDYRREMDSGRFSFLIDKRRELMQRACGP